MMQVIKNIAGTFGVALFPVVIVALLIVLNT